MKNKILHIVLLLLLVLQAGAQKHTESKPFRAYLINNEYDVYLRINFYEQDVKVPGQELYGPLPGYLGKEHNSFCWVITSCKLKGDDQAEMQLINDFGSEDLPVRAEAGRGQHHQGTPSGQVAQAAWHTDIYQKITIKTI